MKTCVFYESGTERLIIQLRMDPPARHDSIVLPPDGSMWLVEHRTFRPTVDRTGPLVLREVVEVWVVAAA